MSDIRARIHVDPDHTITGVAPPDVPPGEHEITITEARWRRLGLWGTDKTGDGPIPDCIYDNFATIIWYTLLY